MILLDFLNFSLLCFKISPRIFALSVNGNAPEQRELAMEKFGVHNPATELKTVGLGGAASVRYNFSAAALYEESIRRGEAELTAQGALRALTGQHTGRSPRDKFVVRDVNTNGQILSLIHI